MTWRERVALLLSAASPFSMPNESAAAIAPGSATADRSEPVVALQPLEFWQDPAHAGHLLQLAGHSSHSSHASHASHASGSGGGYYSPPVYSPAAPVYTPPATSYTPPASLYTPPAPAPARAPRTAPAAIGRLSQDDISKFVQRVQIALIVKGYDPGSVDGDLKPQTRDALRAFQEKSGLEASGNMDVHTLHALGVLK
jgi:His-Xaa-Ser repeat protein HxsA